MQNELTTITWSVLQADLNNFNIELHEALEMLDITTECRELAIDHACIRLNTKEKVEMLLKEITQIGKIISTEEINGRPIHIVQLTEPLSILNQRVFGLEIPYPKPDQAYKEGFEHIEFILPNVTENTPSGIEKAFFGCFPQLEHERLVTDFQFKVTEPGAGSDQLPNPTVGIKIFDIGLKFHAHPIQKIVGYQS